MSLSSLAFNLLHHPASRMGSLADLCASTRAAAQGASRAAAGGSAAGKNIRLGREFPRLPAAARRFSVSLGEQNGRRVRAHFAAGNSRAPGNAASRNSSTLFPRYSRRCSQIIPENRNYPDLLVRAKAAEGPFLAAGRDRGRPDRRKWFPRKTFRQTYSRQSPCPSSACSYALFCGSAA